MIQNSKSQVFLNHQDFRRFTSLFPIKFEEPLYCFGHCFVCTFAIVEGVSESGFWGFVVGCELLLARFAFYKSPEQELNLSRS